ncbi:hypothetical protein Ac2012v2_005669 [Leucoagaricus gongylophorus]
MYLCLATQVGVFLFRTYGTHNGVPHRWWSNESSTIASQGSGDVLLFDMACGTGEVTLAFAEWLTSCKSCSITSSRQPSQSNDSTATATSLSRKLQMYCTCSLGPNFPAPLVVAADLFTSVAYTDRTSLPCANLSFNDIAEGNLPPLTSDMSKIQIQPRRQLQGYGDDPHNEEHIETPSNVEESTSLTLSAHQEPYSTIEMIVCSFALHLIETPSELFTLLYGLSHRARWLLMVLICSD